MREITKKYINGEVTVIWKPSLCIHSAVCFNGLPTVFDPRKKPWVNLEGSDSASVIEQVKKCPSGALNFLMEKETVGSSGESKESVVEVSPNGPLLVYGNIAIKDSRIDTEFRENVTAFCRCGASSNKPYCDGSHKKISFRDNK
jgi:uncharacterized Fe-S cluster protein YjdI